MALEIEKRWLLKQIPDIEYDDELNITQLYIGSDRYRMSYSKKTTQTSFYKTTKTTISPGVNEEVEEKVSAETFWIHMENAEKIISKTRYIKKEKKLKWELDVFKDLTIIILEVEVPDESSLEKIRPASWAEPEVLLDITGMKQFSNINLAHKV